MNKVQFESLFLSQMKNIQNAVAKEHQRLGNRGFEAAALISDVWELLIRQDKWSGFLPGDDNEKQGEMLVRWVTGFIRNLARRQLRGKPWDCVNPRSRNRKGQRVRIDGYYSTNLETGEEYEHPELSCDPFAVAEQTEEWDLRRSVLLEVLEEVPENVERIRRYHEKETHELQNEMGISGNALRIRIFRDKKELREAGKAHLAPLAS